MPPLYVGYDMPEHVDAVNKIAEFFREQVKSSGPQWKTQFSAYVASLEAASAELVNLYGLTSALPPDLGNVHDLPPELLEELSIAKGDELDDQIVTVVNSYGGEATLDQILVGLYRKFKVSQKRRFMQNKLYRMPMIWSVDGRKGVYTASEPEDVVLEDESIYIVEADDPELPPVNVRNSPSDMDDEIPW